MPRKKPGLLGHNSGKDGSAANARLKSFIERIERLEEEKAQVAEDIKSVYSEAKMDGFDARTIREIVKLRKLDPRDREEREALLDIYKAALGMLSDTPLGEAAIRRLSKKPEEPKKPDDADDPAAPEPEAEAEAEESQGLEPVNAESIEAARAAGHEAGAGGEPVMSNPFPAHDKRRAAWDEGWCAGAGSDGMEIPPAWRRSPKPKKGDDKKGQA